MNTKFFDIPLTIFLKHLSLNVVVVKPLSTMNILTPRLPPWYSHDPVKSRSDIRHCVWAAMTALAIMFQTRYSNEQKHSYTTKNIVSVAVKVEYWQLHWLSVFCRNFGSCFTLLPANFHVLHSTLIYFVKKFATDILRCFSSSLLRKLIFIRSFSFVSFLFSHISRICSFEPYSDAFWNQTSGVLQQVQWYVTPCAENLARHKVCVVEWYSLLLQTLGLRTLLCSFLLHPMLLITLNTSFHKTGSYRYIRLHIIFYARNKLHLDLWLNPAPFLPYEILCVVNNFSHLRQQNVLLYCIPKATTDTVSPNPYAFSKCRT